jgi:hypothetical protein
MNGAADNDSWCLVGIVRTVFPDIKVYENDVPQNFVRPGFLIIRPDKNTSVRELTKFAYEETKTFTLYAYVKQADVPTTQSNLAEVARELETLKHGLLHYIMGTPKYLIPDSDRRYLTVEVVSAQTDDVNAVITFTIRTKKTMARDLRRPQSPKIMEVVNNGTVIATGKE